MVLAIVDEANGFLSSVSIHRHLDGAALQAIRVFDGYLVRRCSDAIIDREFLPGRWNAGLDEQHLSALLEPEY